MTDNNYFYVCIGILIGVSIIKFQEKYDNYTKQTDTNINIKQTDTNVNNYTKQTKNKEEYSVIAVNSGSGSASATLKGDIIQ
jgi:hypothetical protein